MDHWRSEPDTQEAFSQQAVRIQADLLPVDDEKAAWLRVAGGNGRHTVQLVPNRLPPQDRRFARGCCLGVSKRAGEGVQNPLVPGAVGPQEGLWPRAALLRNHSTTTERGIRAVALGTQ